MRSNKSAGRTLTKRAAPRTGPDWLDNGPIREAVEEAEAKGLTKTMICERIGWHKRRKDGTMASETSQLDRRLGRRPDRAKGKISAQMSYENAVKICEAIGRDPWELGL